MREILPPPCPVFKLLSIDRSPGVLIFNALLSLRILDPNFPFGPHFQHLDFPHHEANAPPSYPTGPVTPIILLPLVFIISSNPFPPRSPSFPKLFFRTDTPRSSLYNRCDGQVFFFLGSFLDGLRTLSSSRPPGPASL